MVRKIKFIAECWNCKKEHDASKIPHGEVKFCKCGGYVVTPSGKVKGRIVHE